MAVNKRKILDSARKYVQKGSRDRALREYEKLLQLDPRDAKLRLEIGDAHRRWGQVDEAIGAYTKVAEQYTKEGFDARAVAVYKQIQNLDPDRYTIYEPLAELYQRMGLTSEAVGSLQTAADGYHRDGNKRQALELLRKMAGLDPGNTSSRIKVADLLRQENLHREAIGEYDEAAAELIRQGEPDAAIGVQERILEIEPDHKPTLASIARLLVERNEAERAEPYAKRLLELDVDDSDVLELLADIYRGLQRDDDLVEVYRRLAELYERRGDDEHARAIRQRYLPPDSFDADEIELGEEIVLEEPAPTQGGGDLLDHELLDEELLEDEVLAGGPAAPAGGEESPSVEAPPAAPAARAPVAPDPDADPEQLLAEASVYLRYGKRDQAIANLESILLADPRCRPALEKLGEAHAEGGEPGRAVEQWLRAAEVADEEGDALGRGVLRDRIAALDEAAAARLDAASQAAEPAPEIELEPAAGDEDALPDSLDVGELDDIEIDIDEESFRAEPPASDPPAAAIDDVALDTADFDGASASASASISQRITEDLEEAEFYTQQGLSEEAEAIYRRLLEVAPNHPLVQVRLGEIAAARGDDPGASGTHPATGGDADATPATTVPAPAAAAGPSLSEEPDPDGWDVDADDLLAGAEEAGADAADDRLEFTEPEPAVSADDLGADDLGEPAGLDLPPEEESFDLAAALSQEFDPLDPGASSSRLGSSADDFAAVFSEFKKGVSQTLSESDYEAHYDLGIAYREMGLLADALGEFQAASGSDALRVECLHLMGLCALDQEQAGAAIAHLERALSEPGVTPEQQLAARFALGRAFEAQGEGARAREAYEAVAAQDASFCEVEERIEALAEAEKAPSDDASLFEEGATGEFESFDDVIAEVDGESREPAGDEAPGEAGEGLEDFSDLMGDEVDAAAEAAVPEPVANAAPAAVADDPPAEAEEAPVAPAPPRRRKAKKISFV